MNGSQDFASLFNDRKINTKIGLGFACVLIILAIVSAIAYRAFASSAEGVATFAQRVAVVGIARDIDHAFILVRRFVREYAFTGIETNVDSARREMTAMREQVKQGQDVIKDPERLSKLAEIGRLLDTYAADFEKMVVASRQQAQLQTSVLDPVGAAQRLNFLNLIDALTTSNAGATSLANKGLAQLMLIRLDVSKFIGRHQAEARHEADQTFDELAATLRALDAAVSGTAERKALEEARTGVDAYRQAYLRIAGLENEVNSLVNDTMAQMAEHLEQDTVSIKTSGLEDGQRDQEAVLDEMSRTGTLILEISAGGLLAGCMLAWLIGRAIGGPVVLMSSAMRALAAGDTAVVIPAAGRKDEVGEMAATVQVFRDNMLEAERLRAGESARQQKMEDERRQAMMSLAAKFEADVVGIVDGVGSSAAELQTTAESMSATAEETTRKATNVAAASEQATRNVQTVAAAAEELSSSIAEIGHQVTQASGMIQEGVRKATESSDQMRALTEAAGKIGNVVDLISDIAGQTNLLALNATIEAARAGEAGKGFAVVASEVKVLANQTAKATGEIAAQIRTIQDATQASAQSIQGITETIGKVHETATAIASAVEQQGAATQEISRNVLQAAQGTQEVSGNIVDVSMAARKTGTAAAQVLTSAGELARNGEALRTQVAAFLRGVRAA